MADAVGRDRKGSGARGRAAKAGEPRALMLHKGRGGDGAARRGRR